MKKEQMIFFLLMLTANYSISSIYRSQVRIEEQ